MNFTNKYNNLAAKATELVAKSLGDISPSVLFESCSYSALAPGKRFRPVLSFLVAELFDLESKPVAADLLSRFAAALELIHTATLVHDDLPALDNDTLRRGRPTSHVRFGEDVAVLTGDALFGIALRIVSDSILKPLDGGFDRLESTLNTEPADSAAGQQISLVRLLSAAFFQICEGQYCDLRPETIDPTEIDSAEPDRGAMESSLILRHRKKTGALIAAAACGPAIIAQAAPDVVDRLSHFGYELGMLFQITDDLLDTTSSADQIGKHSGIDQRQGRVTFTSLFGVEEAQKKAVTQAEITAALLNEWGEKAESLNALVRFVLHRTR